MSKRSEDQAEGMTPCKKRTTMNTWHYILIWIAIGVSTDLVITLPDKASRKNYCKAGWLHTLIWFGGLLSTVLAVISFTLYKALK